MNKEWKIFCAKLNLSRSPKPSLTAIHPQMAEYNRAKQNTKEMVCYKNIGPLNVFPLATFSVTFPSIKKNLSCYSRSDENNWQGHMLNVKSCAFLTTLSVFCSVTYSFQRCFNIAGSLAMSKVCFKMC